MDDAVYNLVLVLGTLLACVILTAIGGVLLLIIGAILSLPIELWNWLRWSLPERLRERRLAQRD